MDPNLKTVIDEMQANSLIISSRIQDLIDAATLSNFTHASNSGATTDAALVAALQPISTMLRMMAHPSSPSSAT